MHQHITAPIIWNDEAVPPYRIEPLYSAFDTNFFGEFGEVGRVFAVAKQRVLGHSTSDTH